MERYNEYKDSSVQWLGEIPSHWECEKAKRHFQSRKQIVGRNSSQYERLALTLKGVIKRFEGDGVGLNPEKLDTYQIVGKDDLIFKLIDLENVSTSRVGLSPYKGIVSPAYIRISAVDEVNIRFAEYYYLNMWMRHIFNDLGTPGVRSNLSSTDLLNLPLLYPSIVEQKAIATYLDKVTAKIDEAIAQQQKMIDLLNERKQIIINNAVTKGLNPDAPMKDSGVDWIGVIPEHWEINKFRNLFKTRTGITFTKAQLEEEGEPVISYGQIHSKENWGASVNPVLIRHIPASLTKGKESALAFKGDFLFADTSEDFEGCGNCVCIDTPEPIYAGYHTILAKRDNDEHEQYLAYLFASSNWRGQLRSMVNGVKVYSVTQSLLKAVIVLLPPKSEQIEIAEYITKRVVLIDAAIKRHTDRIKLLQERKQIIINDVVTGKVKVC